GCAASKPASSLQSPIGGLNDIASSSAKANQPAGGAAAFAAQPDAAEATCGGGKPMMVHLYAVGQARPALIDLPNLQHALFDTGDSPTRPHCGAPCSDAHEHLMGGLAHDLGNDPIALVWISHQHSDHIGGAPDILDTFSVEQYVDNGRDGTKAQIEA